MILFNCWDSVKICVQYVLWVHKSHALYQIFYQLHPLLDSLFWSQVTGDIFRQIFVFAQHKSLSWCHSRSKHHLWHFVHANEMLINCDCFIGCRQLGEVAFCCVSAKDSMSQQPPWKAELTLNFSVAQDKNRITKMLCNGAQLQFVPPTPSSPTCSEPKYEVTPPSPLSPRRLKAVGRPPNLPLPELPERWVNHYGLIRSNGIYGQGRQGMGSKFMFNCNNGGVVHDYQYHHHYQR